MPVRRSDAFVLTSHPLGEGDKVCSLFTREYGKVRAVAAGARRPRSRFGASLEPLTEAHVIYYEKETRELVQLRSCDLLVSPFEKAGTPEAETFLHHVAELVDKFQPTHEPSQLVYRLLKATIEAFHGGRDLVALSTYFEVWTLKLGGFFGDLSQCVICGRTFADDEAVRVAADGAPSCRACSTSARANLVQPPVRHEVSRILKLPPTDWAERAAGRSAIPPLRQLVKGLLTNVLEHELKTELILDLTK